MDYFGNLTGNITKPHNYWSLDIVFDQVEKAGDYFRLYANGNLVAIVNADCLIDKQVSFFESVKS